MTLTGIGADSALVGAVLALHVDTAAPLAAAARVHALTVFAAHRLARVTPV